MKKLQATKTQIGVEATAVGTSATFVVTNDNTPSLPLEGTFKIQCATDTFTEALDISTVTVEEAMAAIDAVIGCDLKNKYELYETGECVHPTSCISWFIQFKEIGVTQPDVTLKAVSMTQDSVDVTDIITVNNAVIYENTGSILLFEPVPFDFLRTPSTINSIDVMIGDMPAICPAMDCGYTYIADGSAVITGATLNGDKSTLTLAGTSLPT